MTFRSSTTEKDMVSPSDTFCTSRTARPASRLLSSFLILFRCFLQYFSERRSEFKKIKMCLERCGNAHIVRGLFVCAFPDCCRAPTTEITHCRVEVQEASLCRRHERRAVESSGSSLYTYTWLEGLWIPSICAMLQASEASGSYSTESETLSARTSRKHTNLHTVYSLFSGRNAATSADSKRTFKSSCNGLSLV